jgi:predicted MFS family arabinose efflux permease
LQDLRGVEKVALDLPVGLGHGGWMVESVGSVARADGGADARGSVLLYALGLALGAAVALGLARFAYGLLLPPMRSDLDWSYAQAGALNTANALGYLGGAVVAAPIGRRLGTRRGFACGMALAAVSLLGAGLTPSFVLQLLLRLAAGVGSALTFIGGAALVAKLGERSPHRSGLLLSLYTGGAGVGIVISGLLVTPLLASLGPSGWHAGWIGLAVLSALCLVATLPALRAVSDPDPPSPAHRRRGRAGLVRPLLLPGFGYLLFGGGYIAYMTFAVAYLKGAGFSRWGVTAFWTVLGVSVLAGVPLWGRVLDRLRSGHALALLDAVLVVGAVLPLVAPGLAAGMASAVVFGGTFMAVPAAMAHVARRVLPPHAWAAGIGGVTVAFAVGQSVGPGLAGVLADTAGGAGLGLVLAAVVLAAATLVYLAVEFGSGKQVERTEASA